MKKATLFAFVMAFGVCSVIQATPWGKDADLAFFKPEIAYAPPAPPAAPTPFGHVAKLFIFFHQTVLTNADGPRSHHVPSSSEYMKEAINRYGFFKGYILGCDRLLRENNDPWIYPSSPGDDGSRLKWDPVP